MPVERIIPPKTKSVKERAQSALEKLEKLSQVDSGSLITPSETGGVTVELFEEPEVVEDSSYIDYNEDEHYANLVNQLSPDTLEHLADLVISGYEEDERSRSDWMDTIEMGLDLLGVGIEEKTEPFEGACSAQHPLLIESAVKFQSKASNELLPADGPVKCKILGDVTLDKEHQANRVKKHMNYQLTEEMTEFYPDAERMLLYVPLVGSGFKKTYHSSSLERPVSEFVPADQFVVPAAASDLFRSERYTHILYKTENSLERDFADNLYTKPECGLGGPSEPTITPVQKKTQEIVGVTVGFGENNKGYTLYEQHVVCHIPELAGKDEKFKVADPYIITVDKQSRAVLGVRRNWKKGDTKKQKRVMFTHYQFVPSFNFYGFGFLHLLGNLQLTLTSSLRSLVDAGQFANLQGGFKLKGVRIADDGTPVSPGQFKDIESSLQDINKAIMPLPFKEPSQVLYQMLEFLDRKGQKFADSTEQVIADSTNYGPVGTTMALLDASTKFFSAIHKRLHKSLKDELKIISDINADTLPDNIEYNVENETLKIKRDDYGSNVAVVPVSDPNISSSAHRMAKAQTLLEFAMRSPEIHDMREVLKHVYTNMDYPNIEKILPEPEQAQANDLLTDIKLAVEGKPIKAFEGQDHKAHIALKQAFLQDPMSGGNPAMQKASIQLQANIQEHMLLGFLEQTQALAQQQGQMTEGSLAQAAQQIAQMNVQKLQEEQAQAQHNMRDQAALLLAQAEMLDTQTQARKQAFDEQYKIADLELKKEKIDLDSLREVRRSDEFNKKTKAEIDKVVTTKGLDAMIAGLSNNYTSKKPVDKA